MHTYMKIYKLHKQTDIIGYLTNWNCKLQRKTKKKKSFVSKHKEITKFDSEYQLWHPKSVALIS